MGRGKALRITLINPRCTSGKAKWLPLGLAYVAAKLLKDNEVKVIDADVLNLAPYEIANMVKDDIDVVGITAMTPQINDSWKIAELIKEKFPKIKIILGGVHPSILPEESIEKPFIDEVFKGEYDYAFNLDDIPFPARHLFPFPNAYSPGYYRKTPYATILTSRGCPGRCSFCNKAVFGSKFRARSAENVVDELEYLKKDYGIREFHISDDNFTTDVSRAIKICDLLLERKLKMEWACSNGIRVDFVNQELLDKMKKSGCYRVAFGIESGSPEILNNINKHITLEKIEKAVKMAKKAKLITVGFFMVGNYGETDDTINKTIRFIKKLSLDYTQFTITTPYPGTELAKQVNEKGRIFAKSWSDYNTYTGSVFEWDNLPKEKIDGFQTKIYKACYLNPAYIFKRLINIKPNDIKFLFSGLGLLKKVIGLKEPNNYTK